MGEIATAEERIAFVTAAGFDFTKEELKNVQEKMQLTDEELGSLAGGGTGYDTLDRPRAYDISATSSIDSPWPINLLLASFSKSTAGEFRGHNTVLIVFYQLQAVKRCVIGILLQKKKTWYIPN